MKDITGTVGMRGKTKSGKSGSPFLAFVTLRELFGIEFVWRHAKHIVPSWRHSITAKA
jgi:hypothetical protein